MKKSYIITIVVLVYLAGLVVMFPARVATALVPLPDEVRVGQITGTIWQGTAGQVQLDEFLFHEVRWELSPWSLFRGQAGATLRLSQDEQNPFAGRIRVQASGAGVSLYDVNLITDIPTVQQYLQAPVPVPLRGNVQLRLAEFTPGQPVCQQLAGELFLANVQTRFGDNWANLGAYDTELDCRDGRLGVRLNPDNMLELSADGTLTPSGVDVRLSVRPREEAPERIQAVLQWMGSPDEEGRRHYHLQL